MKKTLPLFAFLAFFPLLAPAQFLARPINTTTPTATNSYSVSYAAATATGVFTNTPLTALNTNYVTMGDSLTAVSTNVNAAFTNIWAWSQYQSNFTAQINANLAALSNNVASDLSGGSATLPTNLLYSVQTYQTYQTNYAFWSRSNFLARVPGLWAWQATGGDDGGGNIDGLPTGYPVSFVGSYSGTSGWFPITNGFTTSNTISVSLLVGTNVYGSPQVDPGMAQLTTLSDWSHAGQLGLAVNLAAVASTGYVATAVANATAGQWTSTKSGLSLDMAVNWAGTTALDISFNQQQLFRSWSLVGTNILIGVAVTNLTPGWAMYSSTNLDLLNGFSVTTNYTTNIVSGICTFTLPIQPFSAQYYFDPRSAPLAVATFNIPVQFQAGISYASNTWNFPAISNALVASGQRWWTGDSNNQALVTLSNSNGVVRYAQALR